ncbi:hypothetical protein KQH61_00685 [bacterium]|nr:hypothetical protein [bacterium]
MKKVWKYVELIISIVLPIVGGVYLVFVAVTDGVSADRMLQYILTVVCLLTVIIISHRFVTLSNIDKKTNSINQMVTQLSHSPELLNAIQSAGIMNIYPKADDDRMDDIINEIRQSTGKLLIAGVALPSMVSVQAFKDAVLERSKSSDVCLLLLNPESYEADRRADIERSLGRATIAHIQGTISWIQEQQAKNHRFRAHLYDLPPMLSLVISNQFVFVEPYHFGKIEGVEGCIGGKVPMMKILNQPNQGTENTYDYFLAHFNYLWEITRGQRVNLDIEIVEAALSQYVTLENHTGDDIRLADWKLSGQKSDQPYHFEIDDIWKADERIVVSQEVEIDHHQDRVFRATGNFMGNNSILRMTTASGILVGEWSIPQATGCD